MISIQTQPDTVLRIKELLENLRYLNSLPEGTNVVINEIEFATPLSVIPIASIINQKKLRYNYQGENASYLKVIRFPEGINELSGLGFQKTYIPIIHFHLGSLNKQEISQQLNVLHSKFLNLLRINIIADERFIELITNNTFGFVLGEMIDNIEEHSNAKNMYLFAQYWVKNNSCEVCLLDDGDGLLGSLKNVGRDVNNSYEALRKILETGLSAKTEYGDIKQGTGIKYTRLALTNREINGEFFIMSGNAAFLHSAKNGETFINFKNYFWQGAIVMMKLNKPISTFNLYNYVR
jgi:hypothetical protein